LFAPDISNGVTVSNRSVILLSKIMLPYIVKAAIQ
jgi:hypothetical protein